MRIKLLVVALVIVNIVLLVIYAIYSANPSRRECKDYTHETLSQSEFCYQALRGKIVTAVRVKIKLESLSEENNAIFIKSAIPFGPLKLPMRFKAGFGNAAGDIGLCKMNGPSLDLGYTCELVKTKGLQAKNIVGKYVFADTTPVIGPGASDYDSRCAGATQKYISYFVNKEGLRSLFSITSNKACSPTVTQLYYY